MKNLHLIATDKPSRLLLSKRDYYQFLKDNASTNINNHFEGNYQHIYITSDEEIKEGDWYLNTEEKNGVMNPFYGKLYIANQSIKEVSYDYMPNLKKIILTTDTDLIKDGVQPIDDEFLEWFVNNPSCEEVEVFKERHHVVEFIDDYPKGFFDYKIIIPQEEPKPIHKFNNGRGATLCGKCYVIISEGLTEDLYCEECKPKQETIEEVAANLADPNICKTDNWIAGAQWQQEQIPSIIEQYLETAFISKEQGYKCSF